MTPALATLALQEAATGLRETFRLADVPAAWIVVLVIAPVLAVIAWAAYRGEELPSPIRAILIALRFAALALLAIVLFRPVMIERREEVQKAEVLVLIDDSASMLRKDAYASNDALRAATRELAPQAADADPTRLELARALVERRLTPSLVERGYTPRAYAFAETLVPQSATLQLAGRGPSTRIGDALGQALAAFRGHHVTDAVIVSDGRQNTGSSAIDAARAARLAGVQVHSVVIGDTRTERNVRIELVESPSNALEGDEIALVVRVIARGARSQERAQVTLEELTDAGSGDARRVVGDAELELSEAGARTTLVARPGPADPRTHERRFRVSVPPLDDETLLDDNAIEVSVHVTEEKVRVLYVEGYPRWEYRRLMDTLKRADDNIQVQCFLLSATSGWVQESSKGMPPLAEVPTDRKELLDRYDVILLGDVSPFAISPDQEKCDQFIRSLREFVERGGGLAWIAGEYDTPRSYLNTALEELLPVVIEPVEAQGFQGDTTKGFRPLLDDPTNPHEIVRLLPDAEANRRLWEEDGGLLAQYWYWPVTRAKPGSQVLLRHPSDGARGERYPLLVVGYFPTGRTMFSAMDSTHRWLFIHKPHFERFWRNAVRWLSLGRLKSGDRRWRLEVARNSYNLGERVAVEARVLDEDYRPSEATSQNVRWTDPEGKPRDLMLSAVAGRAGVFRGTFETERIGIHRVWIDQNENRIAGAEFEVVLPSLENQDPSPDPALLAEIAALSGGASVDLARVDALLEQFPGGEERREPISARLNDVWDRWTTLVIALLLLSVEWILRKRFDLV